MRMIPAWLVVVCRVVITGLLPVVLVLTNVRLLGTPAFLELEYRMPGFPPDPYGFTPADRLKWSKASLDFLLNDQGIDFVRRLRFAPGQTAPPESCKYYLDGDCNRLYNDRELKHMSDTKAVVRAVLNAWVVSAVLVLVAASLLYYFRQRAALRGGLLAGAGLTIVILIGLVVYLLISWNTFFTQFHQMFFTGDSWIFLYTDTFIRLFPERFWQDFFLFAGGGAVVEALLIAALAWYRLP